MLDRDIGLKFFYYISIDFNTGQEKVFILVRVGSSKKKIVSSQLLCLVILISQVHNLVQNIYKVLVQFQFPTSKTELDIYIKKLYF